MNAALPWLARPLERALRTGRDHHAWLIHGPQGVGQFELALALATAWLCESPLGSRPCGQCPSCKLVDARSHPDLLVLLPEALQEALGWATDAAGEGEAGGKTDRKPSKDIKVDAVRQAVAFAQTSSARGQAKVVLIHPADRLNVVAANTLLKTLEEPPGIARFVLAASAPQRLPATVRSRCRAMYLAVPDPAEALAWLNGQGVAQAEILLRATGGLPLEARDWAGEGIDAAGWTKLPAAVAAGDPSPLQGWPVPRAVEALQKVCHDALLIATGVEPRYFARVPRPAAAHGLHDWARALARVVQHAEHPWNAGLLVESLVLQGRDAYAGRRPAPGPSLNSPP